MSVSILNQSAVKEAKNVYYRTCDAGQLSQKDLLIVILEPIIRNRSVSAVVDDMLQKGLAYLGTLSEFELSVMFELDERQSFQLMAIFELAKRMSVAPKQDEIIIRSPDDVRDAVQDLKYLDREHFVCLYLNTKGRVIGRETVSIGTLNAAIVHPREVFKGAIRRGAASVIFAHNHPSGVPSPSAEDISLTERLAEGGELLGIEVLDHIIIGGNDYYSFKEQGTFPGR
ncbi:RadC family protein [Marinicrinis lubricantis]|uniref:DNA repair protein RadC n=1 Tax=Marinicrinis lubricantis TaxID=2086470 RepID=A0ABW1INA1_9BACL